jgi:hypothetical protein
MPFRRDDVRAEPVQPIGIVDQLGVEVTDVPVIENAADVEDDGVDVAGRCQPWRALNRRFVLLMT